MFLPQGSRTPLCSLQFTGVLLLLATVSSPGPKDQSWGYGDIPLSSRSPSSRWQDLC